MAPLVFTTAQRPDLAEGGIPAESVWPEYNLHGAVTSRLWARLHADLPQFQFGLYGEDTGEPLAQGRTVPCWWDGTDEGLSSGVDHSLRITGTVSQWESWTGLAFPDSGEFVFPGGLAPVAIDRDADVGTYWEPNVWMIHR